MPASGRARGPESACTSQIVRRPFRWPTLDNRDIGEKPVATTGNGLDKARILGRIAEGVSNLADGFVETVIEVDDRLRPDLCAQFLPADQFSWPFQQHSQQSKGLLLQWQALAMLRQLADSRIGFENPKSQTLVRVVGSLVLHGRKIRRPLVFGP